MTFIYFIAGVLSWGAVILMLKTPYMAFILLAILIVNLYIKNKTLVFAIYLFIANLILYFNGYSFEDFLRSNPQLNDDFIKKGFYFLYFCMYNFSCIYCYYVFKERLIKCIPKIRI